jgi:uncharacterized membrane protein
MSITGFVQEREQRRRRLRTPAGEPFQLNRRERRQLPLSRPVPIGLVVAVVAAATAAGAAIRLAITHGLSLDELENIESAHSSFGGLISHLAHGGVQAPLHPVLLWCSLRLFGDNALAARLPSEVAGILLIPVVAWLAAEIYDRRTAIVAVLFACVAPILVWYSQSATPYILVALFGTLTVIGMARIKRSAGTLDWVLYTVAAALTVWSDWSGIVVVAATEAILAVWLLRRRADPEHHEATGALLRAWGLSTLALAFQLLALGVLFASELRHVGGVAGVFDVGASGVTFYTVVSNGSWLLFGFQPTVVSSTLSAVWPLAMLASLTMIGRGVSRAGWPLLFCALAPLLAVFVLGLFVPSAFDVRFALVSAPLVLVLFARLATAWPQTGTGRMLVVGAILALLVGALVDQQLNPANPQRYDYAAALSTIHREGGSRAVVLYEPANFSTVLRWYGPELNARPLSRTLPRSHDLFVVTSFANNPPALALRNREIGALRATRHLVGERRYPGVEVWWFR